MRPAKKSLSSICLILLGTLGLWSQYQSNPSNTGTLPLRTIRSFYPRIEAVLMEQKQMLPNEHSAFGDCRRDIENKLQEFEHVIFNDVDRAHALSKAAYEDARQLGYQEAIYRAAYNKAFTYFVRGEFESALKQADSIGKEVPPRYGTLVVDYATLKSWIYTEMGQYAKALELGLSLLGSAEASHSDYAMMRASSALSFYYLRTEEYDQSLRYCLLGLDAMLKLRQIRQIFPKLDEIARIASKLNHHEVAWDVYNFYDRMEKKFGPAGSYIQSMVLMNRSEIYLAEKQYDSTLKYLNKAISIITANNYRQRMPRAYLQLAELHMTQMDTLSATPAYEKSLESAEDIHAYTIIKETSQMLANIYRSQQKTELADKYLNLHNILNDTLFNVARNDKVFVLEGQRRIMDAQKEIQALKKDYQHQSSLVHWLIAIILLVSALALLVGILYVGISKQNRSKADLNHPDLQIKTTTPVLSVSLKPVGKYKKPVNNAGLDTDVKEIILAKLLKLEKEKFFLETTCSLIKVAKVLKTNTKYLSQVINEEKKHHFTRYINDLRIEYLLERLENDSEFRSLSLSEIALSVGYNNLNTLNSAFKKRKGMLPSIYIKSLNQAVTEKLTV